MVGSHSFKLYPAILEQSVFLFVVAGKTVLVPLFIKSCLAELAEAGNLRLTRLWQLLVLRNLAHGLLVKKDLYSIFDHRRKQVTALFPYGIYDHTTKRVLHFLNYNAIFVCFPVRPHG